MDRESVSRPAAIEQLLGCRADCFEEVSVETVGRDEVSGRTLAEDLHAPRDVPPRDYATMDGYAVATRDDQSPAEADSLTVVGEVAPEDTPPEIDPGETVRIATGAPLPSRADAVLKREDAAVTDGELSAPEPPLSAGTNVHRQGTTAETGEVLFAAGENLAPRHAALLCDLGVETVRVHECFSVGIVATGTEIHEGRQPDRDSDFLAGLVRGWGHEPADRETVPDDPAAVRETIKRAAATHDAVLTTGGTSVGSGDYVSEVLSDHDLLFAGVRLRPGRPVTGALVGGTPVIALPGKPLAAHTAAVLVARMLFVGETPLPTLVADPVCRVEMPEDDIEYAVPVVLDGSQALPLGHADSSLPLYEERFAPGLVASSTRATLADGFVLTQTRLEPGELVAVVPYPVVE